jgi:hypothetical protein
MKEAIPSSFSGLWTLGTGRNLWGTRHLQSSEPGTDAGSAPEISLTSTNARPRVRRGLDAERKAPEQPPLTFEAMPQSEKFSMPAFEIERGNESGRFSESAAPKKRRFRNQDRVPRQDTNPLWPGSITATMSSYLLFPKMDYERTRPPYDKKSTVS